MKEAAGMNFDSEGFGKIDGRYVVATTTTFGKVGDYVDFPFLIDVLSGNSDAVSKVSNITNPKVVIVDSSYSFSFIVW